jgi:hypothetical protein
VLDTILDLIIFFFNKFLNFVFVFVFLKKILNEFLTIYLICKFFANSYLSQGEYLDSFDFRLITRMFFSQI